LKRPSPALYCRQYVFGPECVADLLGEGRGEGEGGEGGKSGEVREEEEKREEEQGHCRHCGTEGTTSIYCAPLEDTATHLSQKKR